MVGRMTLGQWVLQVILVYAMLTSFLSIKICEETDHRICNSVWGTVEERKNHFLSWELICAPKELGGLGLKMARHLNMAYMTNLAFLFMKEHGSRSRVQNGKEALFWSDRWLDSGIKIVDHLVDGCPNIDMNATFADMVTGTGV
ncbi:hypothetical protein LINPERHAP1_LOCUS17724 [Linum perenne]